MAILKGVEVDDLDGERDEEKGYRSLLSGPKPEARHFRHRSEEQEFLGKTRSSSRNEARRKSAWWPGRTP